MPVPEDGTQQTQCKSQAVYLYVYPANVLVLELSGEDHRCNDGS